MGSRRLPGKVLREVAGKPILQYLLERLGRCRYLNAVMVCTSSETVDTPIADFCRKQGVACHRGSLSDVAGRFKDALGQYPFDGFVRVSGDSPLLDQHLVDRGLQIFRKGGFEVVTNNLVRTYPSGQTVEILQTDTFLQGYQRMSEEADFEHVTRFFYRNCRDYRVFNFTSDQDYSRLHFSIDTPEDIDTFARIVAGMEKPHWEYGFAEIVQRSCDCVASRVECHQ